MEGAECESLDTFGGVIAEATCSWRLVQLLL